MVNHPLPVNPTTTTSPVGDGAFIPKNPGKVLLELFCYEYPLRIFQVVEAVSSLIVRPGRRSTRASRFLPQATTTLNVLNSLRSWDDIHEPILRLHSLSPLEESVLASTRLRRRLPSDPRRLVRELSGASKQAMSLGRRGALELGEDRGKTARDTPPAHILDSPSTPPMRVLSMPEAQSIQETTLLRTVTKQPVAILPCARISSARGLSDIPSSYFRTARSAAPRPRRPRLERRTTSTSPFSAASPTYCAGSNVACFARRLHTPYRRGIARPSSNVVFLRTQNDGNVRAIRSCIFKTSPPFEAQRPYARALDDGATRPTPISDDVPAGIRRRAQLLRAPSQGEDEETGTIRGAGMKRFPARLARLIPRRGSRTFQTPHVFMRMWDGLIRPGRRCARTAYVARTVYQYHYKGAGVSMITTRRRVESWQEWDGEYGRGWKRDWLSHDYTKS
ncbi:hypothetical protein C8J57DRAFT_1481915 [Mycena rebaudengoi]|nr:hypothetical protein C8J57DRAFT_1481915 [Mycena rebaudengoi]